VGAPGNVGFNEWVNQQKVENDTTGRTTSCFKTFNFDIINENSENELYATLK